MTAELESAPGERLIAIKRRKVAPVAPEKQPVKAGLPSETAEQTFLREEEERRAKMAADELARIKAGPPRGFGKQRVYRATVMVLKWPIRLVFGVRRRGAYAKIPRRGPLLLVSNHVSAYDPVIFGATVARPITFLAKSYVFRTRFGNWFFQELFGQIKVDRQSHGNEAALVSAVRALKRGQAVCVYPEGARTRTGHLCRARSGAARIALATGEAVWPVVTKGMYEMAPRGTAVAKFWKGVEVIVGPPLSFPNLVGKENDKKVVRHVADQIMLEMAKLIGPEEVAHHRMVIQDEEAPLLAVD